MRESKTAQIYTLSPRKHCGEEIPYVHRISASHGVPGAYGEPMAGEKMCEQINRPPFTKVAQARDDKLPLIQLLIDPPSNLPRNVQRSAREDRGLPLTTLDFGTLAQKFARPSGAEIYHHSYHVSTTLPYIGMAEDAPN